MNLRTVSIGFALFHAVAFLGFLAYFAEANQRDGQAMLLWGYWLVIDFPVSLLVPAGWWIINPDSPLAHYWLYAVHGILGTMWWCMLPVVAVRVYGWAVSRRSARTDQA